MNFKKFGYVRVSTFDQKEDYQVEALLKEGIRREDIYIEKASGKNLTERPILTALLTLLCSNDELYVWKFDRLGRNCRDILNIIHTLSEKNVKIIDITNRIDYSTSIGKLMIAMLGAIAEMERNLTRERTLAALVSCKAKGIHLGRDYGSYKVNPEQIIGAYNAMTNKNISELARTFKISTRTIYTYLKKYNVKTSRIIRKDIKNNITLQEIDNIIDKR